LEIITITFYDISIIFMSVAKLRRNLTVCVIQEALRELILMDNNTPTAPVVLCSSDVLRIVKYTFLLISLIYLVKYEGWANINYNL
jgi:hypothetical protein